MRDVTRRSILLGLATAALPPLRAAQAQESPPSLDHLTPAQRARFEAMHSRMMAALHYERVTVAGAQALAEWERLRGAGRGLPVIIGSDQDLERVADQFSIDDAEVAGTAVPGASPRTPSEILAAAERIDFPADLRRLTGYSEGLQAPVGDWPTEFAASEQPFSIALDPVSGRPHDRVHILLLPARASWEVPAYLRWGGWNACPPPEYHVAALRRWHMRHGAELVAINGDTMNVRARPAATRGEAMALAREQYEYCPDIVEQGTGSLSPLAAGLMSSQWWYFWWD